MAGLFRSDKVTLGDRVVVRRYLDGPGSHLTDIIGHVLSLEPLVVRPQQVGGLPSTAPAIEIPSEHVQVLKRLSPRRVRNSDIRAVEVATAKAFPGREQMLISGWLARAGADIAERSNSATPIGHSAGFQPVPLDELREFYHARGMPVQLLVPERIGKPAEKLVGGWSVGPEIITMTRELDDDSSREGGRKTTLTFRVDDQPDEDWLAMYHFRGQPLPEDALRDIAARIDGTIAFGRLVSPSGETVAVTRGTITESDDDRVWLGYSAVEVAPRWRRRGVGTQLGTEMLKWGREGGATHAYLQVLGSNEAGLGLYSKLGFVEHHRLRYLTEQLSGR